MYGLALEILKAASRGPGNLILWLRKKCGCIEITAGSESFIFENPDQRETELARSALHQLVTLDFIQRDGVCYRITSLGTEFARSYDLPDESA